MLMKVAAENVPLPVKGEGFLPSYVPEPYPISRLFVA
jgi:hypothetical protein